MEKSDKLVIGTIVLGLIILSVLTAVPQVTAENQNNNPLANETTNTLSNDQGKIPSNVTNNTGSSDNSNKTSQLSNMSLSADAARKSTVRVQATLSPPTAFPANTLVNTRAFYDISFTTASSGTIGDVLLTFPLGTVVNQAAVVEVRGLGPGTISSDGQNGQTVTYTVTSPTSIAAGTAIRLQVDYVTNPPSPSPLDGYQIGVITRDPAGAIIDSGTTSGYEIKQIQSEDIANNAITTQKFANYSVTHEKIAPFAVQTNNLGGQVVTSDNIETSAIQPEKIANSAVTNEKIAPGAVTSDKIAQGGKPEVIRHGARVVTTPHTFTTVRATCGPGEVATGGGHFVETSGAGPDVHVVSSLMPTEGPVTNSWEVMVLNYGGHLRGVQAEVICLKFP
jgi:hypothetical protein